MALTLILYSFFNFKSFVGLILILIGHGFIRRSLFQRFNSLYFHSESRKIFLKKAIKKFSGLFYFFFFFVLCLNSSLPLNLTFFSEIIVGITLFYLKKSFVFFFVIRVFLIGLYKINLFLFTNQGLKIRSFKKIYFKRFSFFICFLHIFFNFFLVIFFFKFF
jgi:NADH:ubiquinone oxidoreductase subunit 4 (subunit M)